MGKLDIESKKYFSGKAIFADALNYFLYDGKQVIKPESLEELDTTQIAVPFGNGARVPVQKYRDVLKLWNAMMSDDVIYVIFGVELQGKVNYAMPVKNNLYDAIGYSKQVDAARASYKKKRKGKQEDDKSNLADTTNQDDENSAEIVVDGGDLKIKLTSEEFLSGFHKDDRLIPIVTIVVYLGAEPWDGPLSLYDMFDVKNKDILKFVPNYFINLISPANMEDEDFEKFSTNLGLAMKAIKEQKEGAIKILSDPNNSKIGKDTAYFLNSVLDLKLEFVEKGDEVDMCLAMQKKEQRDRITGAIEGMRLAGMEDKDIISKLIDAYGVTKEYIVSLLNPSPATP